MAAAPEPVQPQLRLIGLVENTAMLLGSDGVVYFARTGERVAGADLVAVNTDNVVLSVNHRRFTYRVNP